MNRLPPATTKANRPSQRKVYLDGIPGMLYLLALLASNDGGHLETALEQIEIGFTSKQASKASTGLLYFYEAALVLQNTDQTHPHYLGQDPGEASCPLAELLHGLLVYWLDLPIPLGLPKRLGEYCRQAHRAGLHWFAAESALLLEAMAGKDDRIDTDSCPPPDDKELGFISILHHLQPRPHWQVALQALKELTQPDSATPAGIDGPGYRMAWFIGNKADDWQLQAREQKRSKTGKWTKGRVVALKRLVEDPETIEYLRLDCHTQPLADGPRFHPGEGGTTIMVEVDGKALQTRRDLDTELEQAERLKRECPALAGNSGWSWELQDPEEALETLLALQQLDDQVVLEWPRGKPIRLSRETGVAQMQVRVSKKRDWFGIDGELILDDGRVLQMSHLLELIGHSPGRFVALDDGEFLSLTRELRERLDTLRIGGNGRFHPLAAELIEQATDGMKVKAGKPWKDQLKRLQQARELEPQLPSTLQAELRDYQREGYAWLARLAHWGPVPVWPTTWAWARPYRPWRCWCSARPTVPRWSWPRPRSATTG